MNEAEAYEERKKQEKSEDVGRGCLFDGAAGCLSGLLPVIAALLIAPLLLR